MKNLGRIGIKCLLISLAAIACSVALTVLCERTSHAPLKNSCPGCGKSRKRRGKIVVPGRGALPRAENAERKQEGYGDRRMR